MKEDLYSVVVPVYRSERSLRELVERIHRTFAEMKADYELVLVEDGGGDNSWEIMKSLREENERVKIVRLTRNFGQHNALMCGFSFASGNYVVTIDDDLQNPPEEIPRLIEEIHRTGLDLVCGTPEERKQSPVRKAGSFAYRRLVTFVFRRDPMFQMSNFRIIRRGVIENILHMHTPNPAVGLLILNITDRIGNITVEHLPRRHGRTTYTAGKLIRHFFHGVLYHSTLPLKGVFWMGLLSMFAAFSLGVYYLALFFMGRITVPGWSTLVLLVLFFSGAIMFSLGIIGEYLLRITQEVYHAPQYVIREKDV